MKQASLILLLFPLLFLAACWDSPDYAPPIQRQPLSGVESKPVQSFAEMADPSAEAYIVRDIQVATPENGLRWTNRRPELRFVLEKTANRKCVLDIFIPGVTFNRTGPVTLSVYVNDKLLGKELYSKPGEFHFEKPVPAEWLSINTFNFVRGEVDKHYIAEGDGAYLGYQLRRAGFR